MKVFDVKQVMQLISLLCSIIVDIWLEVKDLVVVDGQ